MSYLAILSIYYWVSSVLWLEKVLWLSLGLLVLSFLPTLKRHRFPIAGLGWIFFGVYWATQPAKYIDIGDYFNGVLTILVAIFCAVMGYSMIKSPRHNSNGSTRLNALLMATKATAVGGIAYFIFAEIPFLKKLIISTVTTHTIWLMQAMGIPAVQKAWNYLTVNGHGVEIILACTAIESMALFIGVISCVNAPPKRVFAAFLASIPVIYVLNLFRNTFVISAYGLEWFGTPEESFYIAHSIIAKIGSTIALFFIAYAVLRILPEVVEMIDGIGQLLRGRGKEISGS